MTTSLKNAVVKHVDQHQLSVSQLERLAAMQAAPKQSWQVSKRLASMVAALFVVVLLSSQYWPAENQKLTEQIAYEVVKNHIKAKPLEVESAEYSDVLAYFDALDFSPIQPAGLESNYHLAGARYCSIQGESAAQLRYFEADSKQLVTVYEVDNTAPVFAAINSQLDQTGSIVTHAKGVEVTIWREQGVMLVKTRANQ